jgi:hypothetical protein
MASFDPVLDLMRPRIDAPEITMRWAALEAARRFCWESRAYREWVELDLKAGYPTYTLVPNVFVLTDDDVENRDNSEVIGIEAVEVEGVPYDPVGPEQVSAEHADGVYVFYPLNTVQLFQPPAADVVSGLRVRVVIQPVVAATGLPDGLNARFARQINFGATALLRQMSNEPWSNAGAAAADAQMFERAIVEERVRADLQYRTRSIRTRTHG